MSTPAPEGVHFAADGLIPVVAQDAVSGDVLMLAYMNDEALRLTRESGFAHYFSRGRNRIWRKGETSGNTQAVEAILVNCERNSLLLRVRQHGAVCHDGYPTCFYRRVEPDETLTVVRERAFDPVAVYETTTEHQTVTKDIDRLAEATRQQFAAYAFLRDHDLTSVSGTSMRLRGDDGDLAGRIGDELRELAGVMAGEHRHEDRELDIQLEASQVIYWVFLRVLRDGVTWAQVRPDRALATSDDALAPASVVRLLRAEADQWTNADTALETLAARAHATLALVGQACHTAGIAPLAVVESDIADLRSRSYLNAFFGEG